MRHSDKRMSQKEIKTVRSIRTYLQKQTNIL